MVQLTLVRSSIASGAARVANIASRIHAGDIRKIVVAAGAGLSVPSGLPDFR